MITATDMYHTPSNGWISSVGLIALTIGLCMVPLLLTPILPLIDFYAHLARYYALGNMTSDPWLAENYRSTWHLLPNLGLDVLGPSVMRLLPPLVGAKLLAALIILAPFTGALSLARVIHGRIAPINIALAGLLTFSFILSWGFANFIFGLGIAMWALAMWIATTSKPGQQLTISVLFGVIIILMHGLVFGFWGLLLFCVEIMLIQQAESLPTKTVVWRIVRLGIIAVLPLILFLQTKTAAAEDGVTSAFTNFAGYVDNGGVWVRLADEVWQRTDSFLRVAESAYPILDRLFGGLLWASLAAGFYFGRLKLDQRLWAAVALCVVLVFIMPPNLFGVGHLDERVPLLLLALLAAGTRLAEKPEGRGPSKWLPGFMYLMFVVHIAMVCVAWVNHGRSYTQFLTAVEDLEPGGLAHAVYLDDMQERDNGRKCKSLLPILLLLNGTAVPTFSNPAQHPIKITGPLAQAQKAWKSTHTRGVNLDRATKLNMLYAAGFRTIVACDDPQSTSDTASIDLVAQDGAWSLYQK